MNDWIVERTYRTHNHPTRYWESTVLDPITGLVATSHSDSEEGSRQLARLIAAAPELLEALKEAFIVMAGKEGSNSPFDMERWVKAVNGIEAAIAKAEGTQFGHSGGSSE